MIRLTRTNYAGVSSTVIPDQQLTATYNVGMDGTLAFVTIHKPHRDSVTGLAIVDQTPFGGTLEIAFEEAA